MATRIFKKIIFLIFIASVPILYAQDRAKQEAEIIPLGISPDGRYIAYLEGFRLTGDDAAGCTRSFGFYLIDVPAYAVTPLFVEEKSDSRLSPGMEIYSFRERRLRRTLMNRASEHFDRYRIQPGIWPGCTSGIGVDSHHRYYELVWHEGGGHGLEVLAFDYRHLGDSGGEPRQLVWIPYQLADYAAAVDYARALEQIDPARIALWGTSLSGGHAVVAAARDATIACVSAQVPLLDGEAGGAQLLKRNGLGYVLRMTFGHALRDLVGSWLGLSAHKIPLTGKGGSIAVMADDDAWGAFGALAPEEFVNEACARILIRMDKYKPLKYLGRVSCPVLLQFADRDITNPPALIADADRRLGDRGRIIRYPIDHFDIYLGDGFEQAVADQLSFFRKHLQ